jgi:CHAT domain-containing protein
VEIILKRPNNSYEHVRVDVQKRVLGKKIAQLRSLLTKKEAKQEIESLSSQLYDWLIKPIEFSLISDGIDTLVFVPDTLLRNIPMAVLYHPVDNPKPGNSGRYLIEDYAIAVSLPGVETQISKGIDPATVKVLAAGVSKHGKVSINKKCPRLFADLPYVESEMAAIANLLKDRVTQLFKSDQPNQRHSGSEFTARTFQQTLQSTNYDIVHLATHGEFSSNPQETFILTGSDPIYMDDLQDALKGRLDGTTAPIELLVLSACQTATGDSRAALGLAGVAVRSGAYSTLASLWTVDDASTSKLMQSFYQELVQPTVNTGRQTKAKALRRAQLQLIETTEFDYKPPYYWAPFVLVGSWR